MPYFNSNKKVKYLNQNQLTRLFNVIFDFGNIRDYAIFNIAFYCGLRASEVALITPERVNLRAGTIFCERLKGSISNTITLDPKRLKALKNYMQTINFIDDVPIFLSREHRGISRARLFQLMQDYSKIAKIPKDKRQFHALKHSCAVMLLDAGLDFSDIQQHLGHADIRTCEIYAKYSKRRLTRASLILKNSNYIP